ncbi:MAG TPA: nitroreductase family protein [Polyangiaceae bacterium]|nr:nitroreductase family protein [Polyangiaceae bacterium]
MRDAPMTMRLPRPRLSSKKALSDAFRERRTVREIGARKLTPQLLSNLLFAACGVNRVRGPFGGRGITAASASNSQEIDVYVALEDGTYLFDARRHVLRKVVDDDVRGLALGPRQPNPSPDAPVQLVFVVDVDRLEHTAGFEEPGLHDHEVQKSYYFVDTGIIAANVHLYAASEGLACWFHNCDRAALTRKLKLGETQRVLFAQTIGHPVKSPGRSRARPHS